VRASRLAQKGEEVRAQADRVGGLDQQREAGEVAELEVGEARGREARLAHGAEGGGEGGVGRDLQALEGGGGEVDRVGGGDGE